MKDYPVIKYVIFFICGIIIQYNFELSFSFLATTSLILIIVLIGIQFIKSKFKSNLIISIFLIFLITLSGSIYFTSRTLSKTEYPFEKAKLTKSIVYGEIISINLKQEQKLSMVISVDSVNIKGKTLVLSSKYMCNIKENDIKLLDKLYDKIEIGNSISVTGTINRARDERNPGEFD